MTQPSENYLLGGISQSDSGYEKSQNNWSSWPDFWVVKTDASGIKKWDKRFGGLTSEILFSSAAAKDGGFLLGGYSDSDSSGNKTDSLRGFVDYWVVKIDSNGNYQWDKTFGGVEDEVIYSIIASSDGGFLLIGYSASDSCADKSQNSWTDGYYHQDIWVVKIDSVGNKIWDKRFGGLEDDVCKAACQLKEGSYILGGTSISFAGGDKSQNIWGGEEKDYWILKIDKSGNKIWDRDYGGLQHDACQAIASFPNGNIVVGGSSQSIAGGDKSSDNWGEYPDQDYWVLMLDSNGNKIWDNHFGGLQNESLLSIAITNDGNILAGGTSQSHISGDKTEDGGLGSVNAWMIKIDTNGNKIWDKTLVNNGYNGTGYAVESSDGGYVLATATGAGIGGDKTSTSHGGDDYFFAKYYFNPLKFYVDSILCQKDCVQFSDASDYYTVTRQWFFEGGEPATDTADNPIVCYNNPGVFDVTLILSDGIKSDTLIKQNVVSVFATPSIPVISQQGDSLICTYADNYQWYLNQEIISGATDKIYITTSPGFYSVQVISVLGCSSFSDLIEVGISNLIFNSQFQIFPNPTNDFINISFSSTAFTKLQLKIINPIGQLLFQSEMKNGKQLQINRAAFKSNGMVYCQFFNNEMLIETRKVFIAKY